MDNEDGYIKIGAYIDASGATAGADQVVDGVDKIDESVKKATESTHSLQGEQLGSLRTAGHLFHGIRELGEGGAASIAGLATEVRIAAEVMEESLGPAAPFIIILSTLIATGIPSLMKSFDGAGDSAKGVGDKGKQGADGMAQAWQDAAASIGASLEQIRKAQEKVTKADEADLTAIQQKQKLEAGQAKLDEDSAIEKLRTQYLSDNAKPGLSDADRKLLKEQFEAGKSDIKERSSINTADLNRTTKSEEYGKLLRTRDDQQSAITTNQRTVDELTHLQQGALSYLGGLGLTRDKDGKVTNDKGQDAVDAVQKKVEYAEGQYHSAYAGVREGILPKSLEVANKKALDDANKELEALNSAAKNAGIGEEIKKFSDALPKMRDELAETSRKIPIAITEMAQAGQASDLARASKTNDDQERAQEAARAAAQAARELADREFKGQNKASIEAQEKIRDNKASSPSQVGAADKEIERLKNAALQRDINENASGSPKPLVPGEVAAIHGEQGLNTQKGGNEATKASDVAAAKALADQKRIEASDKKELTEKVNQVKSGVEATGNKEAIAAMHLIVQKVADKQVELSTLQLLLATTVAEKLGLIDKNSTATKNYINSILNSR